MGTREISDRVLIIKNPRRIPEAMESYAGLTGVDVVYVRGTDQLGSSRVINGIVSTLHDDTLVGVISDDTILSNEIVDSVFDQSRLTWGFPTSGWVRIYDGEGDASISTTPFRTDLSPALSLDEYNFLPYEQMQSEIGTVTTFFSGMALHVMSAGHWREFPAMVHRPDVGGGQSDLHMAQRLHAAGLHINVVASAEIRHLKIPKPVGRRRRLARPKHEMFLGPEHEAVVWQGRS